MEDLDSQDVASQDIAQETPAQDVFIAPSIRQKAIIAGASYTHHSATPEVVTQDLSIECVLGVDEAGRGPVLGPMVYGLLYLPLAQHRSLLAQTHHFDDSKVLTPAFRSSLLKALCTSTTDLYKNCGWATRVMSARDIGSGMLKPAGTYNLNAQAMDATIELIKDVFAKGINVREIYIDTIGSPAVYQKKLERIFPTTMITVAKKADSLYPCVSAASVCAKVTRDAALEVCYQTYATAIRPNEEPEVAAEGWGSGYPSDARCTTWLKGHMDPMFGWGSECRFSWGTAKDLLEAKGTGTKVDWPVEDDDQGMRVTDFFSATADGETDKETNELTTWFGNPVAEEVF
ncbi:MAG: hypothetical protein ASARMPREDX12_000363 [Alectoria sarmentosa]|nr:MAG: hypothetical protein ASARMPREDX12_000363 [Alectoria sarmentosa]